MLLARLRSERRHTGVVALLKWGNMAEQDAAIALEEAKLAILGRITESATSIGSSHRVLHLANAYALLDGSVEPSTAYAHSEQMSV